jgi:exodeoxyribonuclease VII small subunit
MTEKNSKDSDSFEAGLKKLEALVESLENKEQSLDVAIKAFEEGVALSRQLSEKIKTAETRLETISKGLEGQPQTSKLELDDLDGK